MAKEDNEKLTRKQQDTDIKFIIEQGGSDNDVKNYLTQQGISFQEIPTRPQDPTVEESFRGIFGNTKTGQIAERVVVDGVIAPLAELSRGLVNASAGFYETLDAAADLVANVTGFHTPSFENTAEDLKRYAETEIPKTNMHFIPKTIYNLAGSTVPVITEFAIANKVLTATGISSALTKAGLSQLSEPAKFALLSALDEYEKSGDYKSLLTGAIKGASFGMAFGIATKGMELTAKYGKTVGRKWIEFTTNNKKLAEDFINNPSKYNLNINGKTRSAANVAKEHNIRKADLNQKFAREKELLSKNTRRQNEFLSDQFTRKRQDVDLSFKNSKDALSEQSSIRLEDAIKESSIAINAHNKTVKDGLVNVYDDALKTYKLVRREAGENVALAIETTLKKNPMASIPYKKGSQGFLDIVKKKSPFRIEQKAILPKDSQGLAELAMQQGKFTPRTTEVIKPRTAAANQGDAKVFDRVLREFKGKNKSGKLTIRYLQDLKGDLNNLSQKAFNAGNNEIGIFYRDLSKSANPAKIISEDRTLSKNLSNIAKANAEFNKVVPQYEEAIKQYFRKDAQGNYLPDINKAVGAVQKGDTVAMRQMRKADQVLPENDRVLPKVQKLVEEMNSKAAQEKGILNNLKRKANQNKIKLATAEKQVRNNLAREQKSMTREQRNDLELRTRSIIQLKQRELNETIDQLDKALLHYENIETLNSSIAQSKLAGWVQRAGFWGAVSSIPVRNLENAVGGGGNIANALAGSGAMFAVGSPKISSRFGSVFAGNTRLQQAIQNETNLLLKSLEFEGGAVSRVIGRKLQKAIEEEK